MIHIQEKAKSLKRDDMFAIFTDFRTKGQFWGLSREIPPMTPIFSKSTPKNHPKTVEKSPVHQKVNKSQWDPLLLCVALILTFFPCNVRNLACLKFAPIRFAFFNVYSNFATKIVKQSPSPYEMLSFDRSGKNQRSQKLGTNHTFEHEENGSKT